MGGKLYVVATPIGNMEDITGRAKRILEEVDLVAAEDTRTANILFKMLGINNKTVSNYKFNEKRQTNYLIAELESGRNVALISDAGTPCISDPGGVLVKAAADRGITVIGVSGASSVITALSICGFSLESFAFYGFIPRKLGDVKRLFASVSNSGIDVAVFFESPKRIKKTLAYMSVETPQAKLCLCNDLTKKFERVYRGTPKEILEELDGNPSADKGEYTLVVWLGSVHCTAESRHNADSSADNSADNGSQSPESMLIDYIVKNNCSIREAISGLSKSGKGVLPKKEFYAASIRLKELLS